MTHVDYLLQICELCITCQRCFLDRTLGAARLKKSPTFMRELESPMGGIMSSKPAPSFLRRPCRALQEHETGSAYAHRGSGGSSINLSDPMFQHP